ncbi:MAG: hypothetical protein PHV34_15005 [Verrucomicrobiae bacterium]|nr:hypothetical protein [Verrucomicrobiae bacterium]
MKRNLFFSEHFFFLITQPDGQQMGAIALKGVASKFDGALTLRAAGNKGLRRQADGFVCLLASNFRNNFQGRTDISINQAFNIHRFIIITDIVRIARLIDLNIQIKARRFRRCAHQQICRKPDTDDEAFELKGRWSGVDFSIKHKRSAKEPQPHAQT